MGPDYGAALLRMLFTQSDIGMHVLDGDLRVVRSNAAWPLTGSGPDRGVDGRSWRDLCAAVAGPGGSERIEDIERRLRTVLATGEPLRDHLWRPDGPSDHRPLILALTAHRLDDADGTLVGVSVAVLDVTERVRAQEHLKLLYRAGGRIGTTLDVARTSQELTDVAAEGVADVAVVDILDTVLYGEAPAPGPVYDRVTVRRVAFGTAKGREDLEPAHEVGSVRVLRYGTPHAQTLGDLRPRRRPLAPDDTWLLGDPHHAEKIRDSGAHSLLVLPLTARGVVLGIVTFYRLTGSPPFDEADVHFAADLAGRAAISIDNARHFTREHTLARLTQRHLVPDRLPEHTAVETAYGYLPVTSSGVWYDVIGLSGARVALVAGDVAGTGMPAVTTMGRLRTVLSALATMDLPPHELLERLHELTAQLAHEYPADDRDAGDLTATCLVVVYDPVSCDCTVASAGHPMPVLVLPDGRTEIFEGPVGPVLGRGVPHYSAVRAVLPEGSVLALRNDALVLSDREREQHLYREALGEPVAGLSHACDILLSALIPEDPTDDAMLLLARTRALAPDQVAVWRLPSVPESAAEARRLVRARLGEWGLDDLDFGTELVASELVTNAVRYSSGPIELRLIRDATLICEVSDVNAAAPHLRYAEDEDEGGRGLYLVAQFTQRWGMRQSAGGKTIWTEQPVR